MDLRRESVLRSTISSGSGRLRKAKRSGRPEVVFSGSKISKYLAVLGKVNGLGLRSLAGAGCAGGALFLEDHQCYKLTICFINEMADARV